jgi:phosphatidylglycerophosphatase C
VYTSAADERPGVAAFDLDGTLTRRDTLLPFLQRLCGTTAVMRAVVPEWSAVPAAARGTIDRDATKARVLARLLTGWVATDVVEAAEDYAEHVVTARLRADTVARVTWHRERGHRLLIVSASPELYVGPVAAALGFEAALATRLEVIDRRLTGRLVGANVRGQEKVRRLTEHLGDGRFTLWAYGDSAGDRELLAAADHPTRVTRSGLVDVAAPPRR